MAVIDIVKFMIVALRNEKGSYNRKQGKDWFVGIVALRNEKGSYNGVNVRWWHKLIVALRNEKGSYNVSLIFLCKG